MPRFFHPPFFRPPSGAASAAAWAQFLAALLTAADPRCQPEIHVLDSGQEIIKAGPKRWLCLWSPSGRTHEIPEDLAQKSLRHMASRRRSDSPPPAVCCNADLSDASRARFRKVIPDLELLTPRHWDAECHKFPAVADTWFRPVLPVPDALWQSAAADGKIHLRTTRLTMFNWRRPLSLQIAPRFCDPIMQVTVSPLMTVDQLLETIIHLLKMPGSKTYEEDNCVVKLSWSVKYDNQAALLDTPLFKLRIQPDRAIEVDARVLMREQHRQKENSLDVIYCADGTWQARSRADRFNTAEEKFRTLMAEACNASLLSIRNHSK